MRPILFNKNEQSFETYGLGELNVTKGTVTRERNGNYTLYAEIPVNDPMVASLEKEMKLKADAGLRTKNQTFEISRIVKDSSNIVKIYGQHISHKLEYMVLRNATVFSGSAYSALSIWKGALIGDLTFDVWSDIQTANKGMFDISKMENARLALGGVEGSILDLYGGEYEFDNTTIRLHKQLGRTAPTVLEYGRNILSAELDETIESAYTSVLPFATYTPDKPESDTSDNQPDPVTVTLPDNYVDSKYKALYAHRRIKVVDFSSEFSTDGKKKSLPTPDKLRKIANDYMVRNEIGKPKINIKIEYADLARTLDYADNGWIEEVELCDIVPVYYPQIGLTDETLKVTTITYDFVNERNESVEFGDIGTNVKSTMQSGLAGKVDDIAKAQQDFENNLPDYLLNAKGNKVWYNRPDNNEHKVGDIWFEKNGLYDRMYVWNGSQWEKRIDTEDIDRVKKEVDRQLEEAKTTTDRAISEANKRAEEALKKAGTLPDTSKLSDQIKQQIVSSPDLQNKVTEGVKSVDGDTIYSKIVSKVSRNFATKSELDSLDRVQNDMGRDLIGLNRRIQAQTLEFNKLTESNKLYERILGTTETDTPDRLSRLVMSSEIFQTEVGKYVTDDNNLIVNSMSMSTNTLVNANRNGVEITLDDGVFSIKAHGLTSYNFSGFTLPIYVKKIYRGETYTLGFKYRIREKVDTNFIFVVKNHKLNKALLSANLADPNTQASDEWREFQRTFTVQEDFLFGEDSNYPFYIYIAKNGWVEFKEPILVRGSNTGPYKPSQFDDAFAETKALGSQMDSKIGEVSDKTAEAKQLAYTAQNRAEQANGISQIAKEKAEDAQAKAIQVAEQARQAQQSAEATRTQVTQLGGSWSVRNLNSVGDVLGAINLNPDGSVKINEGLLSIGEKTIIKDGVIKKSMIGNAQIGTAHISEIDASQARLINVSAKNIVADGLTANIIKGGKLSSLNGVTNFDLQTGLIDINGPRVGIRNQFHNKPIQYLVFGEGHIHTKPGSYTALMSNSNKRVAMDDGSAGIQIWNANDNTTAVNIYGDLVEFMYNATDPKSIVIDTVTNQIKNIEDIVIKGSNLATILDHIFDNFRNLDDGRNYQRGGYYKYWR